jgi:small subunit ribosomal protein S21
MPLELVEKEQVAQVDHALWVKQAVEVIAFVLEDACMKPRDLALDRLAFDPGGAVADAQMAWDDTAHAGNRQAPLPAKRALLTEQFDPRIDQDRQILRDIAWQLAEPFAGNKENDDPPWLVDLGCCEPGSVRVFHRLDHVVDKPAHPSRRRVVDRSCRLAQYRVAHAGDFQESHRRSMALPPISVKRSRLLRSLSSQCGRQMLNTVRAGYAAAPALDLWRNAPVQVLVRDNNVDQALRALKKKMQREGVFREMKLRRSYEKPSERRAREKAEAVRRYRKMLRKRMEREGY